MKTMVLSAIISAIVSTVIWIFKDKVIYNREQDNYKLKLLNELYMCVMIISHSSSLKLNQDQKNKIENSVGKLGFNLQLYFPDLYNKDYNDFLNEAFLLRMEIENRVLHNKMDEDYLKEWTSQMLNFQKLCKKMYSNIIEESKKFI